MTSLLARWASFRNRLIADPAFQSFAERFPLTRPIVRRRSSALFDAVTGFVHAQIVVACVQLGLLEALREEPLPLEALAARLGLDEAAADRLLGAAAGLDLVERVPEGWMLGAQGAAALANPGVAAMATHHERLYADLADPVAALKRGPGGGALARYWAYAAGGDPDAVAAYSALMAASQPIVARQALSAYSFARRRTLLDVGGGEGAFLSAVAARAPRLHLKLFDLPAVIDRARTRFAANGLAVELHSGRFPDDPLPQGADTISFVRVLHDHDDPVVARLLARAAEALPPGGEALIVEPLADTPGGRQVGSYFSIYLWAMGSGRPRTRSEYGAMARKAGFSRLRERPTPLPLMARVLVAER